MNILVHLRLKNPTDSLRNIIQLFNYQKEMFVENIPKLTNLGLVQLDSNSTYDALTPAPKKMIVELENTVPIVIRQRVDEAKEWLKKCTYNLKKAVTNVEEFVE